MRPCFLSSSLLSSRAPARPAANDELVQHMGRSTPTRRVPQPPVTLHVVLTLMLSRKGPQLARLSCWPSRAAMMPSSLPRRSPCNPQTGPCRLRSQEADIAAEVWVQPSSGQPWNPTDTSYRRRPQFRCGLVQQAPGMQTKQDLQRQDKWSCRTPHGRSDSLASSAETV